MTKLPIALIALIALATGCAGIDHQARSAGPHTVAFTNELEVDVCQLHVVPRDGRTWGQNWLERPVKPGDNLSLALAADTYFVRASTCSGQTPLILFDYEVGSDRRLRLIEGRPDTPADPDAFPITPHLTTNVKWTPLSPNPEGVDTEHVRVVSDCERDLRLRLDSRRTITMPADSFARFELKRGETLTIVDADGEVQGAWTAGDGTRRARISSSCDAFAG